MGRKKKNVTKASKTAKGKKIANLSQAHGKAEEKKPSTLDEVWGDDGTSKYGTLDEAQYLNDLDGMTKADICLHASKLGIIPVDDRSRLLKTLLSNFRKYAAKFNIPNQTNEAHEKLPKNIREILEEGK